MHGGRWCSLKKSILGGIVKAATQFSVMHFDEWLLKWVHLMHVDTSPEDPHAEDCHECESTGQAKIQGAWLASNK